jgi:hypothetical protein
MKKDSLLVLLLCFPFLVAAPALKSSGTIQTPTPAAAPAGFPAAILEGTDDFNLAIDAYGDMRGNVGPCG